MDSSHIWCPAEVEVRGPIVRRHVGEASQLAASAFLGRALRRGGPAGLFLFHRHFVNADALPLSTGCYNPHLRLHPCAFRAKALATPSVTIVVS